MVYSLFMLALAVHEIRDNHACAQSLLTIFLDEENANVITRRDHERRQPAKIADAPGSRAITRFKDRNSDLIFRRAAREDSVAHEFQRR